MFALMFVVAPGNLAPAVVPDLASRVVSAAIFKPGLALVVREVKVPAGRGHYKVDFLPDALDGSFWFGSADGAKVGDVQTKLKIADVTKTSVASSVEDLLKANVGKQVTLYTRNEKNEKEKVEGRLLSINSSGYYFVTLKTADNHFRQVSITSIGEVDATGLSTSVEVKTKKPSVEIEFDAQADRPATVQFATLETGAAWAGSYLVNLNDDTAATVDCKAQIGVGSLKLQDTRVTLMAGLPNLPTVPKFDLASGFGSLTSYLKGTQEVYRQYRLNGVDPYTTLPAVFNAINAQFNQGSGYSGGGGYGGADRFGYDYLYQRGTIGADPDSSGYNRNEPQAPLAPVEDLYAYPMGKVSMDPGDRLSRILINEQAKYERLYRWNISSMVNQFNQKTETDAVRNILRLENRGKLPWTGGKCLIVRDGAPVAQPDMPFTAAGRSADLDLGQSEDILTSRDDRELSRKDVPVTYGRRWVEVMIESTLLVTNTRKNSVTVEISYEVSGDAVKADGAEIKSTAVALTEMNKNTVMTWKLTLKPGESRRLVSTHKTYV